jgi:hypothetical protein
MTAYGLLDKICLVALLRRSSSSSGESGAFIRTMLIRFSLIHLSVLNSSLF